MYTIFNIIIKKKKSIFYTIPRKTYILHERIETVIYLVRLGYIIKFMYAI